MTDEKNQNISPVDHKYGQFDLIVIAKDIFNGRRFIIRAVGIFMVIGVTIALLSRNTFKSSTVFIAHGSETGISGGISGLASIAGINLESLGSNDGLIPPGLYRKIAESIPFKRELLQTKLDMQGFNESLTYKEYYINHYSPGVSGLLIENTVGLPSKIYEYIKGDEENYSINNAHGIVSISEDEKDLFELIDKQLNIKIDDAFGHIAMTFEMPERLAAAQMARQALKLLQEYIVAYKIEKASAKLKFIEERYAEKEKDFLMKQGELNALLDQNIRLSTASSKAKIDKVQREHDLAFNVFSQLANQLELQKIETLEDTPVFTIINPVSIPTQRSNRGKAFTLMVFTFIGLIFSICWLFFRKNLNSWKVKWRDLNGRV
ncbi:MAG: hypothetical protein Roseis2KO_22080 [Roseivirga sp.]